MSIVVFRPIISIKLLQRASVYYYHDCTYESLGEGLHSVRTIITLS